jgi:phosphoribosyl 1,2-cyclic phosphodiesterase
VSPLKVIVLGSSSSGNATLIEARGGSLLVDAGFSAKELTRRMATVGAEPRDLAGIVVTHEHTDHVSGASVLARRHHLPIFGTPGTLRGARPSLGGCDLRPVPRLTPFDLAGAELTLLPVPHDAREPAAVHLEASGRRVLVATDLGHVPDHLVVWAKDIDGLVLESNHDVRMLRDGPYPAFLKRRIQGSNGHLSNADSALALKRLVGPRTKGVLLGHLSQRNNTEAIALATARECLPGDIDVRATSPHRVERMEV